MLNTNTTRLLNGPAMSTQIWPEPI